MIWTVIYIVCNGAVAIIKETINKKQFQDVIYSLLKLQEKHNDVTRALKEGQIK
jgi:hypothetical protein